MCSRSSSRYMNLPGSLPAYPPDPITGGHRVLRADRVAWEWPMEVTNCQLGSGFKLLNRCVLVYNPPKGVERTPVLSRDGPKHRGPVVLRRRKSFLPPPVHQTQHPPTPHARGRGGTTRGSSASQPPVVFRPAYPPWVGGWGRLGASSWPQIRRWDRRRCCSRISGPPGEPEIRWILSVGWCPSKRVVVIHCARPYTDRAEGVRWAWNSHFRLLAQVALARER
jgi:hypothetical protein